MKLYKTNKFSNPKWLKILFILFTILIILLICLIGFCSLGGVSFGFSVFSIKILWLVFIMLILGVFITFLIVFDIAFRLKSFNETIIALNNKMLNRITELKFELDNKK